MPAPAAYFDIVMAPTVTFAKKNSAMLQLAFIREHVKLVKERLAIKNFAEPGLVDTIIALDDQRKKLQLQSDTTQAQINALSRKIGQLKAKGQEDAFEQKKKQVA